MGRMDPVKSGPFEKIGSAFKPNFYLEKKVGKRGMLNGFNGQKTSVFVANKRKDNFSILLPSQILIRVCVGRIF